MEKDKKELKQEELEKVAGGAHQSRPDVKELGGGLADKLAGPLSLAQIESKPELVDILKGGLVSGGLANESLVEAGARIKQLARDRFGFELADDAVLAFVKKNRGPL